MFIDIHTHARRKKTYAYSFSTPEELIKKYDEMKVDMAVILPIVNPEIYFPQAVEDILEMCDEHPDRFIPYCNVDPRCMTNSPWANLDKVFNYFKERGCKGIGEVMPNMRMDDPLVQNLFRCADIAGLPVVYDGSTQTNFDFGLYDDPGLPMLENTLLQYPKLVIFGHGPVFWSEIGELHTVAERGVMMSMYGRQFVNLPKGPIEREGTVPKLFRKYPNLMGDLSDGTAFNAIARDENYGPRFLSEFDDRLCFGTDLMSYKMEVELDKLLIHWRETGKISETTFRKIAYENAQRILGC
ncbi:MAG: amidohydrolase family protein [Clostridia bacterium]|nr:amidohydrolase family protein [Clostridia bacterium]